jgi:hypothetical protein
VKLLRAESGEESSLRVFNAQESYCDIEPDVSRPRYILSVLSAQREILFICELFF